MESVTTIFIISFLFLATALLTGVTALSEESEIIMLSTPSNLKVIEGDTVVLPCKVLNLGRRNIRVWKQLPSNILFSGNIAVSRDSRVSLVNESLQIEKITTSYAGEYVCQVSKHPRVNVLHKINVLVPPSMSPDPAEGKVIFRKGESATIFCNPSGSPKPHIVWTYGDENTQSTALPSGVSQVQGSQLHFSSVDVHHAGVYKCTADNDVGEPAVATFTLNVHYAPELLIQPDWAHGDVGATVEFVCTCRSSPPCQVTWLRGNHKSDEKLENSERATLQLKLQQIGPNAYEHSLRVQRITRDDLGQYTCTGKNSVGNAWRTVEISGLAEPVLLRGSESGENSFLLRWKAKSYSPIIEYQLKLRKYKSGDQWTDVVIPASIQEGQSLLYSQSYNVTGLEPGARYEAVLQAHNDFGWNRPSETFLFGEEPPPTEPDFEDPETVAPHLPFYDAKLDVTDPTYLKQNLAARASCSYIIFLTNLIAASFIHLHASFC